MRGSRIATAVAFVLVIAACGSEAPEQARGGASQAAADPQSESITTAGSCVEQYSLDTLKKRTYAFDGIIAKIEPAEGAEQTADEDRVTFDVRKWFKGGTGPESVRRAFNFSAFNSAGGSPHKVGDRVLVAGDDDFVWECGFTQPYDASTAADWELAFAN